MEVNDTLKKDFCIKLKFFIVKKLKHVANSTLEKKIKKYKT